MVEVRRAVFEDYYDILTLADSQLGDGYLKGVLKLTQDNPIWVAKEFDTNELIGFLFVIKDGSKAIIKSVVVKEEYQGKGVGTQLFSIALKGLSKLTKEFEVFAWEKSDSKIIPLERLLNKMGFEQSSRLVLAWYTDSIRRRYDCPSCGNPCICDAVLFSSPSSYFEGSID